MIKIDKVLESHKKIWIGNQMIKIDKVLEPDKRWLI